MRLITVRRQFTEGECFPLFFWSDWHLLNVNCALDDLTKDRNTIRDTPNAMYVNLADNADCIIPDDKRYKAADFDWSLVNPKKMDTFGNEITRVLVEFEQPVIDKCLVKLMGNHEHTLLKRHGVNVTEDACKEMGVPELYAPGGAMVRIVFTDANNHACTVIMNLHHGTHTARYRSTLLNQLLLKLRYWPSVDILARGHCHFRGFVDEMRMNNNANFTALKQKRTLAVLSGGYLKTFGHEDDAGYAEVADLDPMDIGSQRVNIYPSRNGARLEAVL